MRELTDEHNAPFCLFYGETNSGKTTSIVRTAPQPIYYISAEGDALKAVNVCKAKGEKIDIKVVTPDSHEDVMDTLNSMLLKIREKRKLNNPLRGGTLVFDSGTYWMNCHLAIRVEDDRNAEKTAALKKTGKPGKLSAMCKTDWTEVNTANSQMSRLTDLLKSIANEGVMVIMTAQLQDDPKWNSELNAAPCFNYKDYNHALKGYFDYIGYTVARTKVVDGKDKTIYPPNLSFSGAQGYLVKWRGVQPEYLITRFNLSEIFSWFADKGKEADPEPGVAVEAEVEVLSGPTDDDYDE